MEFFGQQNGENVLYWGRKHWLTLLFKGIKHGFIALVLALTLFGTAWTFKFSVWFTVPFLVLLILGQVSFIAYKYKNTYLIITNRRVLISVQRSLLKKLLRSVKLSEIREAIFHLDGVFGSIFKYGKITLQLQIDSSDKQHLYFLDLKNVRDVKFYLDKILHQLEGGQPEQVLSPFIHKKKGQRY